MIRKPRLQWVTVGDLQVDSYAQREYKDHQAQKIADAWDPEKLGTFKVSRRTNGEGEPVGDYIVDGQHRRGAMLKLDLDSEQVPCLVYSGLTIEEEARMFLADNAENRHPTPLDIFRVSLVAKDPTALAIHEVIKDHGLVAEAGGGQKSISAIGSLRWIYEKGGAGLVDQTLTLVENAWGASTRSARDGQLLKGVGKVLADSTGAKLDRNALAERLAREGKPVQLIGTARTHRMATGYAQWVQIAHVIVACYNKQRTTGRIELR